MNAPAPLDVPFVHGGVDARRSVAQRSIRAFAVALCIGTPAAHGACFSGHPALADEFAQTAVVVARVHSARDVRDDPDDPAGISATLYAVEVTERLHGALARRLELRSDNTSSRFPMEPGRRYLLFVHRAKDQFYVDACGNSAELPQAQAALAEARRLSAGARKRPPVRTR